MKDIIKIDARSKNIRELLDDVKYTIDYYQREYKWERKHIEELLRDLTGKFLDSYAERHERTAVERYTHYFLGSIVISSKNGQRYIVDGQQRLTSLTLLLIYLHNLQLERADQVDVTKLIFSEKFGRKSFNLEVPERMACMEALYNGQPYDAGESSESVRNIAARYEDIEDLFPDDLKGYALPYFIDWLKENVDLVDITAYSDDEAYTIFETMNDRGLKLSPTDMLKGYLLANINDSRDKEQANRAWKRRIAELIDLGKEEESDVFKAWLRARYAETIRERKRGLNNGDFEQIGTTFHRWLRDERARIGLEKSADFLDFVTQHFDRYSGLYLRMRRAAQTLTPGLEYVYYNAHNNFTLQYMLALATIRVDDDLDSAERKIRLVAGFLDIFIARRIVNYRTLSYSSIVYTMFNLMLEIRDLDVPTLAALLYNKIAGMEETFDAVDHFALNRVNRHAVHYLLARITHHIEQQSGIESSFEAYISREIKKPFEIEHIWSNRYEQHWDEFTESAFNEYRNRIGGLLLLPRGFNQSLSDDTYEQKLSAYFGQNLLARSLNPQCYQNNPSFLAYVRRSGLPFEPHTQFRKADLDARQSLYRLICEEIWSPVRFERELE